MGRHAVLELDAPTERIEVAQQAQDDPKPLLPTWFLPGLFGSIGLAVVLLLIALLIGDGHRANTAIPAAAPGPTPGSIAAAQTQRYLTDLTQTVGDMTFFGPQYDRSRVEAHSTAWVSAGQEACQLGAQGYNQGQVMSRLEGKWSNESFGQPPQTSTWYFNNIVIYAWRDLC
ncbi:hypothetical protein LQ327_08815 [Actinomycetospora endophytica]|uniref:Uncharacterized protein n=1 Tax=Actinomycetospora endophytica TaxID=2291215 RepID=A0ABS8P5E7_9PSEU|nr:hypothetical protein [Actinomycetospora endophytica]MCD2193482.1 hypothetical protein [Actinomycetospora endophytica]